MWYAKKEAIHRTGGHRSFRGESRRTSYSDNREGISMRGLTSKNRLALAVSLVAGGVVGFLPGAYAETSDEGKGRLGFLEEVIVTAEKREQNLQEVPVAISAFTANMMEARGIVTPQDLQFSVPGLSIGEQNNTGGTAKATIRGVGSENYQPGGDPGVPLHINGHYTQSTAYVFRDMIDVERVEVQRGPQGTLYGRNAVGGNINVITKRPAEEFEGSIGLDVGDYNKRQIQAVVSGPLSDSLRGRLVVADAERDGFVEELGIGDDRQSVDYTSIRGALEFDVTDNIQVYLNAYHFDDTGNSYVRRIDTTKPDTVAFSQPFKTRTNAPNENSDESKGASLDITWNLGAMEFRSLSAYDDTFKTTYFDLDNNPIQREEFGIQIGIDTVTQEFQLLSTGDGPLQWVTGLFYYKEKSDLVIDIILDRFDTNGDGLTGADGDTAQPRRVIAPTAEINAESMAVYGQLDFAITDQFELVAGLRYTRDEKDRYQETLLTLDDGSTTPLFGGLPRSVVARENRDGKEWNEVTGKLGVNFHVNEDTMLYASYSRGYKAGGYNSDQDETYAPEYVDAWEAGMKSQSLDNRIQTNLALFYYDYSDKQEWQRHPPTVDRPNGFFNLINAAKVKSYGAELELQAYVTDTFFVDGSVAYLNAEYNEFQSIDGIFPSLGFQDLSGNALPLSPEWKFNIGAQYDWQLGGNMGSLSIRGDYAWVDDQYGNAFNRDGTNLPGDGDLIPSYHIINARLQWESADAAWLAQLYVRNLTDEIAVSNVYVESATIVSLTHLAPRTYGLKLSYKF